MVKMHKHGADQFWSRLPNPIGPVEEHCFRFFEQMCREYGNEWCANWQRTKMRKVLEVLIECFDNDPKISAALRKVYDGALEDAKFVRGQADWIRDQQISQQQQTTSEKEGV